MIPTFATEDQALEYYPSASGSPDIVLQSVLRDAYDLTQKVHRAPRASSRLVEALTPTSSDRLHVTRSQTLPAKGFVQIGDERIGYESKSEPEGATFLLGITRGAYNTEALSHPVDSRLSGGTEEYADSHKRAELRAFAYYMETQGFVHTEKLDKVGSTRYTSHTNLRNQLKSIMGKRGGGNSVPLI